MIKSGNRLNELNVKMAAFIASSSPTFGSKRLLLPCISITQKCLNTNKKMSSMLVVCASLHTQRRIAKQLPQFASCLFRYNQRQMAFGIPSLTTRWNSSKTSPEFINPPDYIPPTPQIPEVSTTTEMMEGLNALGEPTLASLGLGSYWPPGLVQQMLEIFHVNLGLPWWGSIVLLTVCIRTCMFPITVKSQRTAINMQNHMPTVQKLQQKFTQARQRGDMLAAMQYGGELSEYMQRNKINPMAQFLMPLCQLPVFVSMFIGMRKMANLPVESMTTGGMLWFPDLTVASHFYGLPLLTSLTLLLTIEVGVDGVSAKSQTYWLKWIMRGMPLVMLPLISHFPSAMLVYWFTSNTFSLMQVLFLKIPTVRSALDLPKPVKHNVITVGEKKGFLDGFKENWSNMKASQAVNERQRLDETNYRKAAQGPIIKTYTYNPRKVKGQLKLAPSKRSNSKKS